METWHKRVLLGATLYGGMAGGLWGGIAPCSYAQEQADLWQVINADRERREIQRASIDSENFELGPYLGILSIQDFQNDVVYGFLGAWHITEDFFFEGNYGSSQGDLTSYGKLSGGVLLFEDGERDYSFYDVNLGWNALPGEIFVLDEYALKSDFYFIGGASSTDFLGGNFFTVTIGAGYRLLLSDWITWRIDVRDHIFDHDVLGENETTNNIELSTGLTFFF
jgi:outer membrane beta-barrel protein